MSEDFLEITIPATSEEVDAIRLLMATVTDRLGQAISGAKVRFDVEGDGTFDGFQQVIECEEESGDGGQVSVGWYEYPKYRPRRDLKSIIRASCDVSNSQFRLEDLGIRFKRLH